MIINEVEVGRVYRNIKNKKFYRVEGIGKYTEAPMVLETMVFYKALYKDNQPYWVRPYWLFKEKFEEFIDSSEVTKDLLDIRICDYCGISNNTETLREFINSTEKEFDLIPKDVDGMTDEHLNRYLDFLDYLWTK